jgi:hypothetical protein
VGCLCDLERLNEVHEIGIICFPACGFTGNSVTILHSIIGFNKSIFFTGIVKILNALYTDNEENRAQKNHKS